MTKAIKYTRRRLFAFLASLIASLPFIGWSKVRASDDWEWGWEREESPSDSQSSESPTVMSAGGFESGTKQLFKQNFAPSGWTFVAEDNDEALINTSTLSKGGETGGTWQLPDVNGHAITEAEMPSHDHGGGNHRHSIGRENHPNVGLNAAEASSAMGKIYTSYSGNIISSEGKNKKHYHSQTDTWRPKHTKVITCKKD